MSNLFIDEALLDATGQSEFPELYAYIHEREPKPIVDGITNQIIVGPQYLQDQVKDKDEKLNVQPIPQPIKPIEIPQVQIFKIPKSQLAANVQMYNPADEYFYFYKLRNKVVYNIGLYLSNDFMGFVFTNFLEELWSFSKHALVLGDDVGHQQNAMGYISEKQPYLGVSIGSVDQVTSIKGNTYIAIAGIYYTDYELLKRATSDVNGDGKINIVDDQHVNSIFDGMKSMSWVQGVVQKQTEAIGDGALPYYTSIPVSLPKYFNNNTKLVNNNIFCPLKAAYFVKDGPINSDLQLRLAKFFPIKTSYTLFAVPIPPSVFPQYTVTEVSRDQKLALAYTLYGLDAFKIYIIDDRVNKLVMINMHLRQKGFIEGKKYVLNLSQSIDPKRTLLFPVMILYDFNTDPIQDIPSAYLTVADTDNPARWHIHISLELKADKF
ncbi:MAG: hypothetical protein EZS28_028005, partial [Streblomastix strix]